MAGGSSVHDEFGRNCDICKRPCQQLEPLLVGMAQQSRHRRLETRRPQFDSNASRYRCAKMHLRGTLTHAEST
eukprot:6850703-Alexandrium_andersonii.AAC.1